MKTIKSIFAALILFGSFITVKAQTPTVDESVNNVVSAYIDLKNALVADDGAAAETKAKALNVQIAALQVKDLPAKQQTIWKSYVDKLSFDSRHISETDKIDHQREHFASLSKNIYAVVKAIPVNKAPLYLEYCPMKKANWLSDKQAIENPYYGKSMPDCGSVKETLKAK